MKGVELNVESTEAVVKADRVLTLFMLNTLADNARKFTDREGRVNVSATQTNDYVEIAVEDTGMGMTQSSLIISSIIKLSKVMALDCLTVRVLSRSTVRSVRYSLCAKLVLPAVWARAHDCSSDCHAA